MLTIGNTALATRFRHGANRLRWGHKSTKALEGVKLMLMFTIDGCDFVMVKEQQVYD